VRSKYKVNGSDDAQSGPQKIEPRLLLHVNDCKRHEYKKRYRFLHDLELAECERSVADPVCGNLEQILEQRDAPAHERRDVPFAIVERAKMAVPGERHENVREYEKPGGAKYDWQSLDLPVEDGGKLAVLVFGVYSGYTI
jgi:hypothetical protein